MTSEGAHDALTTLGNAGTGSLEVSGIDVEALTATNEGTGDVTLAGAATRATLSNSGTGTIDAVDLDVADLSVASESTGAIEATATDSVNGDNGGIGSITIHGDPATQDVSNAGLGNVTYAGSPAAVATTRGGRVAADPAPDADLPPHANRPRAGDTCGGFRC